MKKYLLTDLEKRMLQRFSPAAMFSDRPKGDFVQDEVKKIYSSLDRKFPSGGQVVPNILFGSRAITGGENLFPNNLHSDVASGFYYQNLIHELGMINLDVDVRKKMNSKGTHRVPKIEASEFLAYWQGLESAPGVDPALSEASISPQELTVSIEVSRTFKNQLTDQAALMLLNYLDKELHNKFIYTMLYGESSDTLDNIVDSSETTKVDCSDFAAGIREAIISADTYSEKSDNIFWLMSPARKDFLSMTPLVSGTSDFWIDAKIPNEKAIARNFLTDDHIFVGDWSAVAVADWLNGFTEIITGPSADNMNKVTITAVREVNYGFVNPPALIDLYNIPSL